MSKIPIFPPLFGTFSSGCHLGGRCNFGNIFVKCSRAAQRLSLETPAGCGWLSLLVVAQSCRNDWCKSIWIIYVTCKFRNIMIIVNHSHSVYHNLYNSPVSQLSEQIILIHQPDLRTYWHF